MSFEKQDGVRPPLIRTPSVVANGVHGVPAPPASVALNNYASPSRGSNAVLELADGSVFQGFSFGATGRSVAGECVFQTGELLE